MAGVPLKKIGHVTGPLVRHMPCGNARAFGQKQHCRHNVRVVRFWRMVAEMLLRSQRRLAAMTARRAAPKAAPKSPAFGTSNGMSSVVAITFSQ